MQCTERLYTCAVLYYIQPGTDRVVKTNLQDNRAISCDTHYIVHENNIDDDQLRGLNTAIDLLRRYNDKK